MLRILRLPELTDVTGLGKTQLDELERKGEFPRRVRLSERAMGWRSDEVEAWINARPRGDEAPPDSQQRLDVGREVAAANRREAKRQASV